MFAEKLNNNGFYLNEYRTKPLILDQTEPPIRIKVSHLLKNSMVDL